MESALAAIVTPDVAQRRTNSFSGLLTDSMITRITAITDERVYVVLYSHFNSECQGSGHILNKAFISLESGVLKRFPYLAKYSHWQKLFGRVGDTSCFLLGLEETKWLFKKSDGYTFKQMMQ